MKKKLTGKIVSTVLFLLILAFTFLYYKETSVDNPASQNLIYIGGIIFSALLLYLISILLKHTGSNVEKQTINVQNAQNIDDEELNRERMENHSIAILKDIQKHSDVNTFSESLLIKFAKEFSTVQGIAYARNTNKNTFRTTATYAIYEAKEGFVEGIGINGQCAINKKIKLITEIPENYINIISGLGSASPSNLLIIPFVYNNQTIALIELAAFDTFPEFMTEIYNEINPSIAEKFDSLNT